MKSRLVSAVFAILVCGSFALAQQPATIASASNNAVPAHHTVAPKGALPPTLPPSTFTDPRVQAAYAMASKIEAVLYQQPCYCHCDQEIGHKSLLDCFTGDHASICETCLMEGVYAYRETRLGKTPAQIRASIESGQWKTVDLNDLLKEKVY